MSQMYITKRPNFETYTFISHLSEISSLWHICGTHYVSCCSLLPIVYFTKGTR